MLTRSKHLAKEKFDMFQLFFDDSFLFSKFEKII